MPSMDCIIPIILQGDKVIFEDLPCVAVNVDDPYVQILTEGD